MDRSDLQILTRTFGWIPLELVELYNDPSGHPLEYIRLMPPQEAVSTTKNLNAIIDTVVGKVLWTWTDDNSNYLGVCLVDPLKGWIIVLQHDGDSDVPYFRSIAKLISYFRNNPEEDILLLNGEFPSEKPSPYVNKDRENVKYFKKRCVEEVDLDKAGKLAIVAIRLTPVEDTEELLDYLSIDDMWAPSEAISLLRKRGFIGGFKQMEDLASDGAPNGNLDAIHYLKDFAPKDSLLRVRDRLIKRTAACLGPGSPQQKSRDQINRRGAEFALQQLKNLL